MRLWGILPEQEWRGQSGKRSKGSDSFAPHTPPPSHLRFLSSSHPRVSLSQTFSPSVQLAQILLDSISVPACLPEPTEEGTLARLPPFPKIHHVKSSQQRNTAHETHIMVFLKTPLWQTRFFFSSPDPPPKTSLLPWFLFAVGRKAAHNGAAMMGSQDLVTANEKSLTSQQTERGATSPASQSTDQSQTYDTCLIWSLSGHFCLSCRSTVQRLSPACVFVH